MDTNKNEQIAMSPPPRQERTGVAAKTALPLAMIAGAAAAFAYFQMTRPEPPTQPLVERVWTVEATPGTSGAFQPQLTLYGEVVAGREAELRPLVAGRIVEVSDQLRDGAQVRAGELLLAIDRFDFETALIQRAADLKEAQSRVLEIKNDMAGEARLLTGDKAQAAISRNDAARRKKLGARGASSQKAIDDSQMALSEREQKVLIRELNIARLSTKLTQAEAAQQRANAALRRAKRDLEETRLFAPFDGFLLDINAAIGRLVGTNDRVARLIDVSRLEVRFQLSDGQFARLIDAARTDGANPATGGLKGSPATIRWRAGARDFNFDGTVDRVESRFDATAGGVRAYARLATQGLDTPLRPGAFVQVQIPDRRYDNVVSIPERALHDGARVYTVGADSDAAPRLNARPVTVAARSGGQILIRGTFAAGEQIVTTRFPEMGPGVRVRLTPTTAAEK